MLNLSTADQKHLARGIELLLSPLDFADTDAWRRSVNRTLQSLMGADIATFILPGLCGADIFCEQRPVAQRYPDYIQELEVPAQFHARLRRIQVGKREELWGSFYRHLPETRYWNEFLRPNRIFDALTLCVPTGPDPRLEHTAQLIFNQDSPSRGGFTDRELALGRLIFPSLKSGVFTWLRLNDARHAFAIRIDDLDTPIALFDMAGRELHRNAALRALLAHDPQASEVAAGCRRLATVLAGVSVAEMTSAGPGGSTELVVETRYGQYVLRAGRVGASVSTRSDAIVITVQCQRAHLPEASVLRRRFGLTSRQAQVALLLAERKSNAEIADALCISPHTARHHTEAVMEKMGVRDRRDVRRCAMNAPRSA